MRLRLEPGPHSDCLSIVKIVKEHTCLALVCKITNQTVVAENYGFYPAKKLVTPCADRIRVFLLGRDYAGHVQTGALV